MTPNESPASLQRDAGYFLIYPTMSLATFRNSNF
jgi:hypothetical protein